MYGIHKTWSEFAEFMTKKHTPANHNQTIRSKIKSMVQTILAFMQQQFHIGMIDVVNILQTLVN